MTPQEAAEKALVQNGWMPDSPAVLRTALCAIEIYEDQRDAALAMEAMKESGGITLEELEERYGFNRVILTPEQAKAFEEKIEHLMVIYDDKYVETIMDGFATPLILRRRAAIYNALADNREKFS